MADFTIKNFEDVDNSAPEGVDGLEARFARKHLDSEHLGVSLFRYGPGFRAPYGHRHQEQEEAYVVVRGSGRMRLDDDIVDRGAADERERIDEGGLDERDSVDRDTVASGASDDRETVDRDSGGTTDAGASASTGDVAAGDAPALLPADENNSFQRRWEELQTAFVDDPRRTVEQADELVAQVMQRLAEGFAAEREQLEAQWGRGEDISTEDLRVALQRYRAFFQRLLSA